VGQAFWSAGRRCDDENECYKDDVRKEIKDETRL